MPNTLLQQTRMVGQDNLDRLREIHCLLALDEDHRSDHPRVVSMVWGAEHVAPANLCRFLPSETAALSIVLVGGRPNPMHLGGKLSSHLTLHAPVLLALSDADETFVLLLPDGRLGGEVERSKTNAPPSGVSDQLELVVESDESALFSIQDLMSEISENPRQVFLSRPTGAATLPFIVTTSSKRLIGLVEVDRPQKITLSFSNALKNTRIVYFIPERS